MGAKMTDHDLQKEQKIQEELESLFLTLEFQLSSFDYYYPNSDDPRVFREWGKSEEYIRLLIRNCKAIDTNRTKTLIGLYKKECGVDFSNEVK